MIMLIFTSEYYIGVYDLKVFAALKKQPKNHDSRTTELSDLSRNCIYLHLLAHNHRPNHNMAPL